jgi:antitoxin component YwqK of YwqJK toxin-antitoxin module
MINRLFLLLIGIAFVGCSGDNERIEIGDSNHERIICIDSVSYDGYCDMYCEAFYPTGELEATYTTRGDSLLHGTQLIYYKDGTLEDSSYYAGGILFGNRDIYYSNGKIKRRNSYAVIGTGEYSYRNQSALYDSVTGNIIEDSSFYYSFELNQINDSIEVDFVFNLPRYKDTAYIEFGNFDEFFRIAAKETKRYIPIRNGKATFSCKKSDTSRTYIRAIIHNYNFDEPEKVRQFYLWDKVEK